MKLLILLHHTWHNLKTYFLLELDKLFAYISDIVKVGYKTNAYAPLVWAVAIIGLILGTMIWNVSDVFIKRASFCLLAVVILFTLVMYLVILLKDPRLLQSERFRLEDKKLDLIGEKGSTFEIAQYDLAETQFSKGGTDE